MDEKKVEKVTSGTVKVNDGVTVNKIVRLFIKQDMKTVVNHMVTEELLPRLTDALYFALSDGLSMMMGRDPGQRSRTRTGTGSKVSYAKYYDSKNERQAIQAKPGLKLDPSDVVFETRADAMDVLDKMNDVLDQGDDDASVSLSDFLAYAGVPNDNYTYQKWGWQNLSTAEIKRLGDGSYYIRFPRLEEL